MGLMSFREVVELTDKEVFAVQEDYVQLEASAECLASVIAQILYGRPKELNH